MNQTKTFILLAGLTALFVVVGGAIGGEGGMVLAFIFACVTNFTAYWFSDKMVLRSHGAIPIEKSDSPYIYNIVQELADKMKIPMPKVYMTPEPAPNAFATGRNPQHAAVAVTKGITTLLTDKELRAVLGHELGHVINRDILISTIAATMAGALSSLGNMAMWGAMTGGNRRRSGNPLGAIVGILVAPLVASIIRMAISRAREFGADQTGAHVTEDPLALASALQKIEGWSQKIPMHSAQPNAAHMYIINPFDIKSLMRSHPPTEERVRRLQEMAKNLQSSQEKESVLN